MVVAIKRYKSIEQSLSVRIVSAGSYLAWTPIAFKRDISSVIPKRYNNY